MGRTHRSTPSNKDNKTSKSDSDRDARRNHISRTASKLLRHQAENEKIPIDAQGWVRLDNLLGWKGFSNPGRFPPVSIEDVFDVVEHDGVHGKGRFGLKVNETNTSAHRVDNTGEVEVDGAATDNAIDDAVDKSTNQSNDVSSNPPTDSTSEAKLSRSEARSKNTLETLFTLNHYSSNPDSPPSTYSIRATQGHSIKSVSSEGLLTPIILSGPDEIPTTVVHGTFYGSWPLILKSGGLKAMGRNMIHFASGPALKEVLPTDTGDGVKLKSKAEVDDVLGQNKVISGMRWDAQILIYIDLKRCLKDVEEKGLDMKWWKSGNGVILTAGIEQQQQLSSSPSSSPITTAEKKENQQDINTPETEQDMGEAENTTSAGTLAINKALSRGRAARTEAAKDRRDGQKQQQQKSSMITSLVPLEYWVAAIEIKAGLGVIWRQGEGLVRELPEDLKNKPLPRGKQV